MVYGKMTSRRVRAALGNPALMWVGEASQRSDWDMSMAVRCWVWGLTTRSWKLSSAPSF